MKSAPLPPDEAARLEALRRTELLDSLPEQAFDDLTRLATQICGTSIGLVTLVDARRQWFKARVGFDGRETAREVAFCAHAILGRTVLQVPDALEDERFRDNPLVVGAPHVRFYAGAPLVTVDGHALGTLCVLDRAPRTLSAEQTAALEALARQVMAQIELRQRNRRMQESEAAYRLLAENSSDMVCRLSLAGRFLYASPASRQVLGFRPEELVGRPAAELFLQPDRARFAAELEALLASDASRLVSFRALTKDGLPRWIEASVRAVRDGDGEVFELQSTWRNVDARHRIEMSLRESEARFRSIFDNSPIGMALSSPDLTLFQANKAFCQMIGYSAEELRTITTRQLTHPDDRGEDQVLTRRLFSGELPSYTFDKRYVRKDGTLLWGHLTATMVRDGDGRLLYGLGMVEDVTEWRRAADERERFFTLSLDLLCTLDLDGVLLRLNPAFASLLGGPPEAFVGNTLLPYIHEEDRPAVVDAFLALRRGEEMRELEFRLHCADGVERWLSWAGAPVLADRRVYAVGRDITDRKNVELLKNEFISTVSHELRTPLTSIRGALGLLEGGVAGDLPAEAKGLVEVARTNVERLVRLINDILDLEKMEAGRLELQLAPQQPERLVAATIEGLRALAAEAHVQLSPVVQSARYVQADPDRITQVLVNLVSNAVKFSPTESEVRVQVEDAGDVQVRFSVIDHGPGIPPSQQVLLFAKFQQLDQSDSRHKGGTGLGLAISKAIVEGHGGSIGVESAPGRGSSFWFELPATTADARAQTRTVRLPASRPPPSRPPSRPAVGRPAVIVIAADRAERPQQPPDLLVLAPGTPRPAGLDGVETLQIEGCTPLLVYAGRALGADERKAIAQGITRHLTKARASEEDLLSAVRQLIEALLTPRPEVSAR